METSGPNKGKTENINSTTSGEETTQNQQAQQAQPATKALSSSDVTHLAETPTSLNAASNQLNQNIAAQPSTDPLNSSNVTHSPEMPTSLNTASNRRSSEDDFDPDFFNQTRARRQDFLAPTSQPAKTMPSNVSQSIAPPPSQSLKPSSSQSTELQKTPASPTFAAPTAPSSRAPSSYDPYSDKNKISSCQSMIYDVAEMEKPDVDYAIHRWREFQESYITRLKEGPLTRIVRSPEWEHPLLGGLGYLMAKVPHQKIVQEAFDTFNKFFALNKSPRTKQEAIDQRTDLYKLLLAGCWTPLPEMRKLLLSTYAAQLAILKKSHPELVYQHQHIDSIKFRLSQIKDPASVQDEIEQIQNIIRPDPYSDYSLASSYNAMISSAKAIGAQDDVGAQAQWETFQKSFVKPLTPNLPLERRLQIGNNSLREHPLSTGLAAVMALSRSEKITREAFELFSKLFELDKPPKNSREAENKLIDVNKLLVSATTNLPELKSFFLKQYYDQLSNLISLYPNVVEEYKSVILGELNGFPPSEEIQNIQQLLK